MHLKANVMFLNLNMINIYTVVQSRLARLGCEIKSDFKLIENLRIIFNALEWLLSKFIKIDLSFLSVFFSSLPFQLMLIH